MLFKNEVLYKIWNYQDYKIKSTANIYFMFGKHKFQN